MSCGKNAKSAGTPAEVVTQGSVNTRMGAERCVRFAFELAGRRHGRLTLVHKTNVLTFAGDLWSRTVSEVAPEYPDVTWDYNHVDAACIYLVEQPGRYDVVVTDNLFGDILTDLAGAVSGGIGFAASANRATGADPDCSRRAKRANPWRFAAPMKPAPRTLRRSACSKRTAPAYRWGTRPKSLP